jgi:CubicO group peptidase (beta-lactamase class C family)
MLKILRRTLLLLLVALFAGVATLWLKPPALLRVGANYAAKIVCSNVFLAGRDPEEVLRVDVQAPGIAILRLMRVSVDRPQRRVRAGFLGFIGNGLAVADARGGCTVLPGGDPTPTPAPGAAPPAPLPSSTPDALWPDGDRVGTEPALDRIVADDTLAGPGMRAIVVIDHGRVVAERYGSGFSASTPLLGWSMTKTVIAGLIGLLVKDGKLSLDQTMLWPAAPNDARDTIRLADLMAMSSGLRWNEDYGAVSDVTQMLYLEPDMAQFARSQPLEHTPGEVWSYSSGTANILARIVMDAAGPTAPDFIEQRLFATLGMHSALIEHDAHGTPVGSSYMYATARDWARYAQFLLQDGIWEGHELLPRGYVAMMATPVPASGGQYGKGQTWLWGSDALTPGQNPDAAFGIPNDHFWMSGHDGQTIALLPSEQLAVIRLGLTPAAEHYSPQALVRAVLEARSR